MRERELFIEALQRPCGGEREAYLRDACGLDGDLQRRVRQLLEAHDRREGFILDAPAPGIETVAPSAAFDPPPLLTPAGTMIGRYKILEPIGEGGYGTVFMAEQTRPVHRKVALKVVKAGMDTKQVIARFEAERQALALMDHPNIAKVFDAGVTETGRPYFVMELVKGTPVTKYCDEYRLTPKQRLALFVQVCHAIQHAHQKGIIHRDLKPTNVLVAQYDGRPVPKVIDFGVAKAMGQQLTDKTMYTGFGDVIGTLEYMSPEQAEVNQLDVDTRSDIYSLGVLLYELLTGTTPLEHKRAREAALLEVLRVIREEEPPKPSTRLTTAAELPSIAAQRGLDPKHLARLVHGELDWIVMKALDKERSRRYETANGLARDVERYLHDEPVLACPPSAVYRLKKFVRRHANGVMIASAGLAALLICATVIGWSVRNHSARQAATQRNVEMALGEAKRLQGDGKWRDAAAWVERARGALELGDGTPPLRRRVADLAADLRAVSEFDEIRLVDSQVKTNVNDRDYSYHYGIADAEHRYTRVFGDLGVDVDALAVEEAARRLRERSVPLECAAALDTWAGVRRFLGDRRHRHLRAVARATDPDPWRVELRLAIEQGDRETLTKLAASAEATRLSRGTLIMLANAVAQFVDPDQSMSLLRRAHRQHPGDFWINWELANRLGRDTPQRNREALGYLLAAVALRPDSAAAHFELALGYQCDEQWEQAIAQHEEALRRQSGFTLAHFNLAWCLYRGRSDYDGAAARYREVIRLEPDKWKAYDMLRLIMTEHGGPDAAVAGLKEVAAAHPNSGVARGELAMALVKQGRFNDAVDEARQALALSPDLAAVHSHAASVYAEQGRWKEAAGPMRRAVELDAGNHDFWYSLAALELGSGDFEGYRRTCQGMLDRFCRGPVRPVIAERTAKSCAMYPGAVADLTQVERLAERAVTGTEQHGFHRHYVLCKALIECRAGRNVEAIEWIERYRPSADGTHWDATAFAAMAIARHRVRQRAEAEAALDLAATIIKRGVPDPAKGQIFEGWEYVDWLHAQTLFREAEQVLGGSPTTRGS